jgi:prepilin-type N-terminal cleavage/methylation domain-containing protein
MKRRGLTLLELLVVLAILVSLATIIVPVIGHLGRKSQELATRENLLRLQDLISNQYWADMGELPRPLLDTAGKDPKGRARSNTPQLRYLFVNPDTEEPTKTTGATLLAKRHWNGPYVRHGGARYQIDNAVDPVTLFPRGFTDSYGLGDETGTPALPGDPTILDAWGRPVVIQVPTTSGFTDNWKYARLVSAGADGVIETQLNVRMPDLTALPSGGGATALESYTGRGDDVLIFLFRHDEYGEGNVNLE